MMTRPCLGYVIHDITLIPIFFRLPFPIENTITLGKRALGAQHR